MSDINKKNLSSRDYEFMHSLSAAVLQKSPSKLRMVMYFWVVSVFVFIIWANFALIDEIARGEGEIIPSGENQMIQNLEGGIVEEILVKEGEAVEKNQILLKIDNQKSQSSLSTNAIKADALEAKIVRLQAEAAGEDFVVDKELLERLPNFIANERSLFHTNQEQLNSKLNALKEQLTQRKQELSEARSRQSSLQSSLSMINKEVEMTEPMVAKGVRSRIDFLKLQREANEAKDRYDSIRLSIPRLESAIKEVQSTINETIFLFKSDAKLKLNEAVAEFRGYRASSTALEDQVTRTIVRSPMKGIVQKLYVHTVGGVIKPGEDIIEIVPSDQTLLVEVKVKPSDIAFIYYGQKAIVKFSAYDFSIYGGLDGEVVLISADTIKDQKDNVFYTVRIKTTKNFLGRESKPLKIIPGMTVNVDIITGQKSVLDYILKPILKTKQYTFSER
ncbi:MAG: HlyD family type I secretion periplasmic adaptor subunit [Sulfurimonas sp.]|jgi:adhesin transport system membrane fusion protein|nr:HlyD family type I secretion periplasmic adaptor subunit [Sulfurimonas sp.]MBU3938742.1 HlyD family type I secretion periplasmic adaptor subunit [bacterium]MBU4025026.1 HlyD family type I secretion periplasmic adaptor subunit [bacterium]MBU4058529.1 HlyD family type I secretion periplasmic adaptor subunit [bacterium]MBU4111671.1 HlyD family type I secretion periplasmic adaptor subunit [bacterium]